MATFFLLCCVTVTIVAAEDDGWVWRDGDEQKSNIDRTRYQVNENLEDLGQDRPFIGFGPQNTGPYGPNGRPIVSPSYPGNKEVLVGPGGPTGIIKRPAYAGSVDGGDLGTGFVPPWVKDDPRYREYDTCRCRYSFNCPSSGLKFGSCSKDKKYCCFNSRRYPALVPGQAHYPSYPVPFSANSAPNKYGPAAFVQSANYYGNRRPQGSTTGANRYPGNYHLPVENPIPYPRPPGSNPYHLDYDYNESDFYARSARKNQTVNDSTDEKP
ncbi:unnamed protein product [Heterotrigona itama]|uniref:Uncharacterized protein n=1 Tax=Heterotrigona itama TaxID=395501 RepID=A0A6V7HES8_9HYME|nr:unnamed protein product [Heterotrigona itama]